MVGEGGVKNALDPSLGSQALFVAPVHSAVIWLQWHLTLEINGDRSGRDISKIDLDDFVIVILQDFHFFLLQKSCVIVLHFSIL